MREKMEVLFRKILHVMEFVIALLTLLIALCGISGAAIALLTLLALLRTVREVALALLCGLGGAAVTLLRLCGRSCGLCGSCRCGFYLLGLDLFCLYFFSLLFRLGSSLLGSLCAGFLRHFRHLFAGINIHELGLGFVALFLLLAGLAFLDFLSLTGEITRNFAQVTKHILRLFTHLRYAFQHLSGIRAQFFGCVLNPDFGHSLNAPPIVIINLVSDIPICDPPWTDP